MLEIAKQFSGIRSALMLFLSSLTVSHLYIRSHCATALFVLAAIPFVIAKNAIRIFTLSMSDERLYRATFPTLTIGTTYRLGTWVRAGRKSKVNERSEREN